MTMTSKLLLLAICLFGAAYVIMVVIPHIALLLIALAVGIIAFFGLLRLFVIIHSAKRLFV